MKLYHVLFVAVALLITSQSHAQERKIKVNTIAFYNLENLFDTIRNEQIYDESFTPTGSYGWDSEKYENKLENLSEVLSQVGTNDQIKSPPVAIGVCEIENREVLEDLIAMPKLAKYNYGILHEHSPDERGIDAAFLYRKDLFEVIEYSYYEVNLPDPTDKTRTIMMVRGKLDGEEIFVFVNHWPSRSGGEKISMPNRVAAATTLRTLVDAVNEQFPMAKVFLMGDFNDDPISPSVVENLDAKKKRSKLKDNDIFNPYFDLYKKGYGTTAWQDAWSLFDMIMISNSLLESENTSWKFWKAGRYNPDFMLQTSGRFKGYPKRTHAFGTYLNGYSDHFPVYVYIVKEYIDGLHQDETHTTESYFNPPIPKFTLESIEEDPSLPTIPEDATKSN